MTTPNADGPDISHYQTLTDKPPDPRWRLYSHKATEGRAGFDRMFAGRWQWMREQGFRWRGAYHWLRSDSSIRDQAANLCARIDQLGGLLRGEFIQCDWETTPNIAVPTSTMAAEWCDRVQQHYGRPSVIMYSSDWLPDSTLDADKLQEFFEWRNENPTFPYWHANYNTGDGSQGGWAECERYDAAVWQWTSSYSHPSIVGRFDMNHIFAPAVLDLITDQTAKPPAPAPIEPAIGASGETMLYCYIDANGTVWIGNGLARIALDSMDVFAQYVALSASGGGPSLLTGGGRAVTRIEDVQHVAGVTIEALGRAI